MKMKRYITLVLILIPLLSLSQRLYITNKDTSVIFTSNETRLIANKLVDMFKYKEFNRIDSIIISDYKSIIKLKDNQLIQTNNKFIYCDSCYKNEIFNNQIMKYKYNVTKSAFYISGLINVILVLILLL